MSIRKDRDDALVLSQAIGETKLTPEQLLQQSRASVGLGTKVNDDILAREHEVIKNRLQSLQADLPHLYGMKHYIWSRKFFNCTNRINLLCAANQIGKSSVQIRKVIELAGNPGIWSKFWDTPPSQFWYFYPSQDVVNSEFSKKWVPEFLPRGAQKGHAGYGWNVITSQGDVSGIAFNSGVTIFFKTYGQKALNLQTSTVHYIAGDEEMPEEFIDELLARLRGTRGHYSQVFTATRGLPLWYKAMECIGTDEEAFPQAFKQIVSMWDCQFYEDGTPTKWTTARIKEEEAQCTSRKEVLKRIHGRFVRDEGLRYEAFNPDRCVKEMVLNPVYTWKYYAGVDVGSGGRSAGGYARSSAAIVIVAVNPLNTVGRVVRTWRGDGEETTAADILRKYIEVKGKLNISLAVYDYASREFGLLASRMSMGFIPADKTKSNGEQALNLLFKSGALTIDAGVYHNQKLVTELMSIPGGAAKNRKYQDDLADALKYIVASIPWDFSKISPDSVGVLSSGEDTNIIREDIPDATWTSEQYLAWEIRQRRGDTSKKESSDWQSFEEEINAWNDAYGS